MKAVIRIGSDFLTSGCRRTKACLTHRATGSAITPATFVGCQHGRRRLFGFLLLVGTLFFLTPTARADEVGTRKVLAIRVKFPDKQTAPTLATVQARQNGAEGYFDRFSYGKLNLNPTVTAEAFMMPNNSTYYDNNGGALATHAESKARNAGYGVGSADKIGIYYLPIGLTSHATVGGKRFWVQGSTGGATLHEMGHTFGWGHARRWVPDDPTKPLSSKGQVKTADYHFMSGGGVDPTPYEKWGRGWITRRGNVTSDGSYSFRLYTFDQKDTSPTLALRTIRVSRKDFTQDLWLGYRSRLLNNVSKSGKNYTLQQGLVVYWHRSSGSQAVMVDIHAGGGQDNHSIQPGETFSDFAGDVHLTNRGRGGAAPNEYLDVQVNRGAFSGNRPPAPTWDAPTTAAVGVPFTITVSGNDPDGDDVACKWSPRLPSPNATAATTRTFTFNNAGYYSVTAVVTDMKGKTAKLSQSIIVRSPNAATRIWDRDAGTNKWNTAQNWTEDTKPAGDDSVAFDGRTAPSLTVALNTDATVFDVLFTGAESHSIQSDTLENRTLTVVGNVTNNSSVMQEFRRNLSQGKSLRLALTANDHVFDTNPGDITVRTQITGSGANLIKEGEGTLTFESWTGNTPANAANSYSGMTTVNAGTLALNKNAGVRAIAGDLTIGDGAGTDIVRLDNNDQIGDVSVLAFDGSDAIFRLNGFDETVGGILSLTGGSGIVENNSADTNVTLTVDLTNDADGEFDGLIRDGGAGALSLIKQGPAALSLAGANTYTGGTTITSGTLLADNVSGSATGSGPVQVDSSGTLGGNGTVSGPVTIGPGGTLSPGDDIGTLTLIGTLALAGTTWMEVARNGTDLSGDRLELPGAFTYAGSLVVTDVGSDALVPGDTFKLFNAASYDGSFGSMTLPELETGLTWDTLSLTVDGSIRVAINRFTRANTDWILYE